MSAKECLNHPWLNECNDCSTLSGIELTLIASPEKKVPAESEVGSPHSHDDQLKSTMGDNCKNSHISPVLERHSSSLNIAFRKSISPKANGSTANDQKETKTNNGHRGSVDMMVAQFEGLSMSKRIVFSEEIIVDERVGMVY